MTEDGKQVDLTVDNKTILTAVATWCPYSQQYIEVLNDSEIKPYIKDYKLIFVFENEYPEMKARIQYGCEEGLYSEGECQELSRSLEEKENQGGLLWNPDFLNNVPGDFYFFPVNSIDVSSVPKVFSPKNGFKTTYIMTDTAFHGPESDLIPGPVLNELEKIKDRELSSKDFEQAIFEAIKADSVQSFYTQRYHDYCLRSFCLPTDAGYDEFVKSNIKIWIDKIYQSSQLYVFAWLVKEAKVPESVLDKTLQQYQR